MKSTFLLAVATLTGIIFSCRESIDGTHSNTDHQKILNQEQEIKACLTDMWDAIEKEDIDRYASYIHPDFTQFGETDPSLNIGKEEEINGIKQWIASSSDIHTEMEEPRVVIRGDVAWIVYYWNDSGITNGTLFTSRGKSTRIFVRENGKWLCIHGHYTLLSGDS